MPIIKRHSTLVFIAIPVIIVGAIVFSVLGRGNGGADTGAKERLVSVAGIGDFQKEHAQIAVDGTVESLEQAELRSQVSAPVTRVFVAIGQRVSQGQTLVTLQNRDISAQIAQARAGVSAQEARLEELQKGARTENLNIKEAEAQKANQDLKVVYENTGTVLNDAYGKADDAIRKQLDPLFIQDETTTPDFTFTVTDSQVGLDAIAQRKAATQELIAWKAEIDAVNKNGTPSAYEAAITNAKSHLNKLRATVNRVGDAVHAQAGLAQSTVDLYNLNVSTARNEISGGISAVTAQESAINTQKTAIDRIGNELSLLRSGATSEQLKAQQAAVDQARASLENLQAQYAKTIITAPIAGEIASVGVRVGELVTPGQTIASIVNKAGLQIRAFMSDTDAPSIEEGADVAIGDMAKGKVLRISPSVDKGTGKVEVLVLVTDSAKTSLLVGQSVSVKISAKQSSPGSNALFVVPIQAVRISGNAAYVYTVNQESVVEEHVVTLGSIAGETVEIIGGVTNDMKIITIAQDIRAGQKVTVR